MCTAVGQPQNMAVWVVQWTALLLQQCCSACCLPVGEGQLPTATGGPGAGALPHPGSRGDGRGDERLPLQPVASGLTQRRRAQDHGHQSLLMIGSIGKKTFMDPLSAGLSYSRVIVGVANSSRAKARAGGGWRLPQGSMFAYNLHGCWDVCTGSRWGHPMWPGDWAGGLPGTKTTRGPTECGGAGGDAEVEASEQPRGRVRPIR
jgi:hypothetical protein